MPTLGALLLLALLLASPSAWSGSFQVSPVRATLSPSRAVEALTVRNDGAEPAVIQLEAMSWSQKDGKDLYVPTREIIASPPIFTIAPGGAQVVRIGLRRAADPQRELAYRLYLQEVPQAPKPGFQGLQVALRLGVPVFVNAIDGAAPKLRWSARRTSDGKLLLRASNEGTAHIQVANFTLAPAQGAPFPTQHPAAYLLPGQSREWPLKLPATPPLGASLKLVAQTDAGEAKADVVVESP